jgi:hypothetical protein
MQNEAEADEAIAEQQRKEQEEALRRQQEQEKQRSNLDELIEKTLAATGGEKQEDNT